MNQRKIDPAEDAKSALFLAKLTKAAKSHKQQSKVKFHQFEYIHTSRDLVAKRKKVEEDLRTWIRDKASSDTGVWTDISKQAMMSEQRVTEDLRSISYQLGGAKELVRGLSRLVEGGKKPAAQADDIAAHLTEVKHFLAEGLADLTQQQDALEAEVRTINLAEMEDTREEFALAFPEVPGCAPRRLNKEQLEAEYSKACVLVDQVFAVQREALREKEVRNPWPEVATQRFVHIHRIYVKGGKPRERYFERLLLEFPQMTREELDSQDRIIEAVRWASKAKKNIELDWQRHRKALLASAETMLKGEIEKLQDKVTRDAEFVEQEKNLARINQEYRERNTEYQAKLAAQEAATREQQDRERAAALMKERQLKEHVRKTKEVASAFVTQKTTENSEKERQRQRQAAIAEAQRKAVIEKNRVKVQAKREEEMDKVHRTLEQRSQKVQAVEKTKARIESAIAGYSHIPKVEIDRARVQQATESKKAKKVLMDKADAVVLYKQTGFTAENLMRDMRYRISAALNEAGLSGTDYAKTVIRDAPAATRPRADMLSTFNIL